MKRSTRRRPPPKGDQSRIHPEVLAIIQSRKPWPSDLLRWKAIRELEGHDNIWEDEAYWSPAQRAHAKAEEIAYQKYIALFDEGALPGETGDMFFARLDRDAPKLGKYVADPAEIARYERRARARRALGGRS